MKRVILIYSPVDGMIKPINQLGDGVFSDGMLGNGFFIEPSSNKFHSPIDGELVQIFDTKHAYYFKSNDGPAILMHIGLDTVKLDGKPFTITAKVGDTVSKSKNIVDVDFEMIKSNNIEISTPVVFDSTDFKNWSFKLNKEGIVKQGDLVGELICTEDSIQYKTNPINNREAVLNDLNFLNHKSKYEKIAEQIYNHVGGEKNYSKVFNCMTRLRFEVLYKDRVNIKDLEKLEIIKGINWSGNQLQLIIGGEVPKVKEAVVNYASDLKQGSLSKNGTAIVVKKAWPKRFMGAMAAIMLPAIPVLMAAGLLMGIKSILVLSGAMVDVSKVPLKEAPVFDAIFYIVSEVTLKFLGIFIGYNTAKWLGADPIMAILISLTIANPIAGEGAKWLMFSIGNTEVNAQVYTNNILPHIGAAFMLFYLDRWVKTWMPASLDVMMRPLLVFTAISLTVFFLMGPALFMIEKLLSICISAMGKIPLGVGVGLYAALWQPLVLTGMHVAVIVPLSIARAQGIPSPLMAGTAIAIFAQIGAGIAIAIMTKNKQTRQAVFGAIPGALVGVSEPMIYAVNLPKLRPFIAAVIGAGIGGLFAGFMGVESRLPGGMGLFSLSSYLADPTINKVINGATINSLNSTITGNPLSLVMNVVWYSMGIIISMVSAIGITMFIYRERPLEKEQVNKINKLYVKMYGFTSPQEQKLQELKTKLMNESKKITEEDIKVIKSIEKDLLYVVNMELKINNEAEKLDIKKTKLINKIKRIIKNEEFNVDRVNVLKESYNKLLVSEKINEWEKQIATKKESYKNNLKELAKKQSEINDNIDKIISSYSDAKYVELCTIKNNYFNALYSLNISYGLVDGKENLFDKSKFKKHINEQKK